MNMNASDIFNSGFAAQTESLYAAKRLAQDRVKERVNGAMLQVVDTLAVNPDACIAINDIAEQSGVNRSAVRKWDWYGHGMTSTKIEKRRRFAEVDESGKLIPNGKTFTQHFRCSAIKKQKNWR